jgi:hypothetical protein
MGMTNPHPLTVDNDGFVIGADRIGSFGQRPSVGGLGATVQRGDQVGLIVGLDTVRDERRGLLLHLVWMSDQTPGVPVSEADRERVMDLLDTGQVTIDHVPAEGLIALDAWVPEAPAGGEVPVTRDDAEQARRILARVADFIDGLTPEEMEQVADGRRGLTVSPVDTDGEVPA